MDMVVMIHMKVIKGMLHFAQFPNPIHPASTLQGAINTHCNGNPDMQLRIFLLQNT